MSRKPHPFGLSELLLLSLLIWLLALMMGATVVSLVL